MKFLADMGVSMTVVRNLRKAGYEAIHLSEEGLQRLRDREIMEKARQEERIVLTFDLDFGDLLAASSATLPSVIIFRLQNTLPPFVSTRLLEVLSECGEDLETGAIVMVEDSRYRLRQLPI
ncbi:MAG: hypothetical protein F6K41_09675 [Symploca sp. SIO3E6]|nr:hypothetical protein [Caldora sp. SIO3E6]